MVATEQEDGVVDPRAHHHGRHQHEGLRPEPEDSHVTETRHHRLRHHEGDPDHQDRQDHRDQVPVHHDQDREHDQDGGNLDDVLILDTDLVEVGERRRRAEHIGRQRGAVCDFFDDVDDVSVGGLALPGTHRPVHGQRQLPGLPVLTGHHLLQLRDFDEVLHRQDVRGVGAQPLHQCSIGGLVGLRQPLLIGQDDGGDVLRVPRVPLAALAERITHFAARHHHRGVIRQKPWRLLGRHFHQRRQRHEQDNGERNPRGDNQHRMTNDQSSQTWKSHPRKHSGRRGAP